jgi:hypothetical protein
VYAKACPKPAGLHVVTVHLSIELWDEDVNLNSIAPYVCAFPLFESL